MKAEKKNFCNFVKQYNCASQMCHYVGCLYWFLWQRWVTTLQNLHYLF